MCFEAFSHLGIHASSDHHTQEASSDCMPSLDKETGWGFAFSFIGCLIGYIALLGVMVVIVSLILKWIGECREDHQERTGEGAEAEVEEQETAPLLPEKTITYSYGAYQQHHHEQQDIETGDCSNSCAPEESRSDLYDGRICVVCYDEQRNSFFVPCGHCAACYGCAQRIYCEEGRMCPVCRRYIGKIRRL